ncbi:CoA transferase [Aureimonas endophytica]|uniref:CoA transferase n=1 Tax=Aureimonas endophytica TaxID=2027858 RepID=A0A917E514_9HYPH|nr:CaiB/BaiF CoA-transferase family protein [Aureimonas endophytica]GGE04371.1 CoA transferase [Aureimonas endophytica]
MTPPAAVPAPLAGVKVLDLSRVLAGPLCASMLADLGAEVVKVEIPGRGDDSRAFGPFLDGESCYFMLVNRGKKSITLDMKSEEGLAIVRRLVAGADILIENFRPGVTQRLGLDYERARLLNPRLVYVSISGFGQDGPLAQRPAYDHIVQAMGGIMSVTGWPDGAPTRIGDAVGDVVAGLYGAFGALAALLQRDRTGTGQHVDVAMLDAMASLQMVTLSQIAGGLPSPGRLGNAHPVSAPMDSFAGTDGHVVIAVANDPLFLRLAEAIGRKDLSDDPRFSTDARRLVHRDALHAAIEAWTAERSVETIVAAMAAAGIPAAPIWTLSEMLASDHARHRGLLRETRQPNGAVLGVMPQPVRFSGAAPEGDLAAPALGADTAAVLAAELGLTDDQIAGLKARGVI